MLQRPRRSSVHVPALGLLAVCCMLVVIARPARGDSAIATIERVKGSIVAVGTYQRTRSPGFHFRATCFVVVNGSLIATNSHELPITLVSDLRDILAITFPNPS